MTQRYGKLTNAAACCRLGSGPFFFIVFIWQGQCWPTTDQSSIELFFFNWLFSFLFPLDMNVRGPGEREKTSGRPVLRISYSAPDVRYQIQNMSIQTLNLASYSQNKAKAQIGPLQTRDFRDPPDG